MRRLLLALVGLGAASGAFADDFESHWRDGKAEIDGYRLRVSRYGEEREGEAVLVYVTEPLSEAARVKIDDVAKHPPDDVADVLKLNLIRDFQTGIYDYNTMVSVFSRTEDFAPLKVSFSSAEWCGHVYAELMPVEDRLEGFVASYFQGESGAVRLDWPEDGVLEDNLFILVRGLRGAWLAPGETRAVALLPGTYATRLSHEPLRWTTAEVTRLAAAERVTVPAGKFQAQVYEVRIAGGRTGRFHVETEYPHRVLRWELAPDISAELTGTLRTAYWREHAEGDERLRKELGLR